MAWVRTVSLASLAAVLGGCASTAPLVEMPEHRYVEYAELRDGIVQCGSLGKVEPAIAAQALGYLNRGLANYSYNPEQLQTQIRNVQTRQTVPSDIQCNQVAMFVEMWKQQDAKNKVVGIDTSAIQSFQNNMQPKQTYCNKIGAQVFCSSF